MHDDSAHDDGPSIDERSCLSSVEVEVAATPAQVWEAIATAQGNAAWLFPTDIDGRVGGEVHIHRQPYGGTADATVVAWDPPHRFAYGEPQTSVPGGSEPGQPWTTELLVEARAGGTCIVRVVSGFDGYNEAWEPLVDGAAEGWRGALTLLRAYLAHFAGLPAAVVDATVALDRPPEDAGAVAEELYSALGLTGLGPGDGFETPPGAPRLVGVVEEGPVFDGAGPSTAAGKLLRVTEPAPALVEVSGFWMGGPGVQATVSLRFYGDGAAATAAEQRPVWENWLEALTPA
jgi:uncharacterized protein YndB with AHSA1/START domain